jgi:hypothetical protein
MKVRQDGQTPTTVFLEPRRKCGKTQRKSNKYGNVLARRLSILTLCLAPAVHNILAPTKPGKGSEARDRELTSSIKKSTRQLRFEELAGGGGSRLAAAVTGSRQTNTWATAGEHHVLHTVNLHDGPDSTHVEDPAVPEKDKNVLCNSS